jgi:hypothetical protein
MHPLVLKMAGMQPEKTATEEEQGKDDNIDMVETGFICKNCSCGILLVSLRSVSD